MSRLALGAMLILSACSSKPADKVVDKPAPLEAPKGLRLPREVRPTAYELELAVDPAAERITGKVAIDLEIAKPARVIWLNGRGLAVGAARLSVAGKAIPAHAEAVGTDLVAVRAEVPAGPARLELDFDAPVSHTDSLGVFAQKTDDRWFAYTQLETVYARRVFPCFDEPQHKVPWRLTLVTPVDVVAVANMPLEEEKLEGDRKRWRFAVTPPLPSYLLAFAVGPFDRVDAGKSKGGIPIRLYVPSGKAGEATYAAEVTAPIVSLLEDYFGMPHPYPKVDQVAIPQAFGFSAMENVGLVTYAEDLLLSPPGERSLVSERDYAETAIHELAHQWFGNLVTPLWWDDIWLNESLATWAERAIGVKFRPDWNPRVAEVSHKDAVMHDDSLASARRVREPVEDENALANIFDTITYQKGAAVLRMVELWLGEDVFQQGIRAFMKKHRNGSAGFTDLAAALDEASGKDVSGTLHSFLDQIGVPRLTMALDCGDKIQLRLSQERYVPLGGSAARGAVWKLPVCVRWQAGRRSGRDCGLLSEKQGVLPLSAPTCPTRLVPSDAGMGYYRPVPDEKIRAGLAAAAEHLPTPERLALVGDAGALLDSGDLDVAGWLALVLPLVDDPERRIRKAVLEGLTGLENLASDEDLPAVRELVRRTYAAQAAKLGFLPGAKDSEDVRLWRGEVIGAVGGFGADPGLRAQALVLANKWLDDKKAVDADLIGTVLDLAAATGDQAFHARLVSEARQRPDLQDRHKLWAALGGFRDPELVAASLALTLDDKLPLSETWDIVRGLSGGRATRRATFDFVVKNYEALERRLPEGWRAGMATRWDGLCSAEARGEVASFFTERSAKIQGGPRDLAQSLERFDLCIARRARLSAGLLKALAH